MIKKVFVNIIKYPVLSMFGMLVAGMLIAYVLLPDNDFSPIENRFLTGRPDISASGLRDGSYMESFEAYTKEQLPMREVFVKGKACVEMLLLSCENNGITRGRDGFLFEKTVGETGNINKNISAISSFVKETDRDINVLIAPTSTWVLEDKLPSSMPVLDEKKAMTKLNEALSKYDNALVIDLYDDFSQVENREELYYKTDHHWTTDGAYIAYKVIADKMGFEAANLYDINTYICDDFYGTYYAKYKGMLVEPDSIKYYDIPVANYIADGISYDSLYDYEKLEIYDKYAMFMHGNPGLGLVDSKLCDNGKTLIVIKDSYANSVIPFLALSYEKIITIDLRYFGDSVKEQLELNKDADVLLLYNWSFVNEDNHFYKLVK